MQFGHRERGVAQIDAGDRGAMRRHALGENAAAAADVEHGLALEPDAIIYIVEAQRVDVVQRLELAVRVPPARGQLLEFGDFFGIDVLGGLGHVIAP